MKLLKKLLTNNVVGICSGGGHLSELVEAIPETKNEIVIITFKSGRPLKHLKDKKHFFIIDPHVSKIKYLINSIQAFFLYVYLRPKAIISTGAGIAIPFMLIGKIFGSKIIYIESGAKVNVTSRTGRFMYKYSDLFLVQYPTMLKKYPNSKLGSLL